ncbi:MAG: hypothetical protein WEB00_00275 [Dehalococcoidia bacterium]
MDPRVINRFMYAMFVAMFSVVALAAFLASFGATVDGEYLLAAAFTVVTAITVHFVWTVWDNLQAYR